MDQNKIKRYLESLKNTNLNITNTNTIVTQNTLESNTVKLNNTVNLNTNNITYNGDSITLNITSNELKAYLMLDTLDNISNLEFVIPFITKPTSNTNITIYSLTNEILSSYTNDLSGKIHIYLTDIFKKQNAINITSNKSTLNYYAGTLFGVNKAINNAGTTNVRRYYRIFEYKGNIVLNEEQFEADKVILVKK